MAHDKTAVNFAKSFTESMSDALSDNPLRHDSEVGPRREVGTQPFRTGRLTRRNHNMDCWGPTRRAFQKISRFGQNLAAFLIAVGSKTNAAPDDTRDELFTISRRISPPIREALCFAQVINQSRCLHIFRALLLR